MKEEKVDILYKAFWEKYFLNNNFLIIAVTKRKFYP